MIVFEITLSSLADIIPVKEQAFEAVCARYGVGFHNALHAVAENDPTVLDPRKLPRSVNHQGVLDALKWAFADMRDAFATATRLSGYALALEAQFCEDRQIAYIRVLHAISMTPAAKRIKSHLIQRDVPVFKSAAEWDAERAAD